MHSVDMRICGNFGDILCIASECSKNASIHEAKLLDGCVFVFMGVRDETICFVYLMRICAVCFGAERGSDGNFAGFSPSNLGASGRHMVR